MVKLLSSPFGFPDYLPGRSVHISASGNNLKVMPLAISKFGFIRYMLCSLVLKKFYLIKDNLLPVDSNL